MLKNEPGNPQSLVSIIIPVFNRADLLRDTLDSVKNQSHSLWECLVVDDGSGDGSQGIIQSYQKEDQRFRFFARNRLPKGAPTCRNIGIKASKGNFLIFLDSDDLLAPDCLESRLKTLEHQPHCDFLVFQTAVFRNLPGDSEKVWNQLHKGPDDLYRFLIHDNPWATAAPLWKKETVEALGGFDETALCWQDWEFHIRALVANNVYYKGQEQQPDSFYRMPAPRRDSIHTHHGLSLHLENKRMLIEKTFQRLSKKGISKNYKQALSILFFRTFQVAIHHHQFEFASGFLELAKNLNLFNLVQVIFLKTLIRAYRKKNNRNIRLIQFLLFDRNPLIFRNTENAGYVFFRD